MADGARTTDGVAYRRRPSARDVRGKTCPRCGRPPPAVSANIYHQSGPFLPPPPHTEIYTPFVIRGRIPELEGEDEGIIALAEALNKGALPAQLSTTTRLLERCTIHVGQSGRRIASLLTFADNIQRLIACN